MKRLLLLLAFSPFLVVGQEETEQTRMQVPVEDVMMDKSVERSQNDVPSDVKERAASEMPQFYKKLKDEKLFVDWENMGITRYDLQTNSSVGRRVQVYEDSRASVVWTDGQNEPGYDNRGTGYNHFDGSDLIREAEDVNRIESIRSGWPNIGTFGSGEDRIEFTLTHIAGSEEGTGGYAFSKNDGIGSTNFNTTTHQAGSGPIWWRTATSGDWLHMIGTYSDNTDGPNAEIEGVERPTVYYRSNDRGETFVDSNILLPTYGDTTKRQIGIADIYSIDARDSVVAIVMSEFARQLTLWKSTDYGETWETHEIVNTGIDYKEFSRGTWNLEVVDGDPNPIDSFPDDKVSLVLDESGTAHVSYSVLAGYRDSTREDIEPTQYTYNRFINGIHYWNDEMVTTQEELDRVDTQYKDSTAYNFRVEGEIRDSVLVSFDTAYEYSFSNGAKDSTAIDSPLIRRFANYDDSSMNPLMATDTVWPAYYSYEYDNAGNKTDSTFNVDDTLYLDSNQVQVATGTDSVFKDVTAYEDAVLVSDNPTISSFDDMSLGGGANPYSAPPTTRPTIAIGGEDTLYMVFEAMVINTGSDGSFYDYRDLYLSYSTDNGQTWSEVINVTNTAEVNGESAYPSLHKEMVNDQLHLVWQEDELPGQAAGAGENSPQENTTDNFINYAAIDKSLIFDPNTGIEESNAEPSFEAAAYPNPFGNVVNVEFELEQSSEVSYKLYDALGQVKQQEKLGERNSGKNEVRLQTSSLSSGVYFLQLKSEEGTKSLKVVKQ